LHLSGFRQSNWEGVIEVSHEMLDIFDISQKEAMIGKDFRDSVY
jgi:hypothetical protein